MRVVVGPGIGLLRSGPMMEVARALAGPGGAVAPLADVGVGNFSRPLSAAEVALLRMALSTGPRDSAEVGREIVGYVCGGRAIAPCRAFSATGGEGAGGAPARGGPDIVVVDDHVNLTWRSPLAGPNDDTAGPRFPSMTGIYLPDLASGRLSAVEGMIVRTGVVAGVLDQENLNEFEAETVEARGYAAVSAELVPVVIVAAHLGLRVAAAVVVVSCTTEGVA